MKLELVKRRSTYALSTFCDTWVVAVRKFFPLFLSWLFSQAIPGLVLIVTVVGGLFLDLKSGFDHGAWWTLGALLVSSLTIAWTWAGWNFITLKVVRGLPVKFSDLFRPLFQTWNAAVVLALSSVLIWLGTVCFVVPGFLLFLRWQLAPFYIIDRGYGPMKALRQSWHDTDMVFVPLLILDLMLAGTGALTAATVFGPLMCLIAVNVASAIVYSKWLTDEDNPELPRIEDLA